MSDTYSKISESMRSFLKMRSGLFNQASTFKACEACDAKCCSNPFPIQVTVIDLISISLATGEDIDRIVNKYCQFAFTLKDEKEPFKWRIGLGLKKPCPFLKSNRCSIYTVSAANRYAGRPLACAFFPESYYSVENIPDEHRLNEYRLNAGKAFPCVRGIQLSQDRREAVTELSHHFCFEESITELLFFGETPIIIDFEEVFSTMEDGEKVMNAMRQTKFDPFINLVNPEATIIDWPSAFNKLFLELYPDGSPLRERFNEKLSIMSQRPGRVMMFYTLLHERFCKDGFLRITWEELERLYQQLRASRGF